MQTKIINTMGGVNNTRSASILDIKITESAESSFSYPVSADGKKIRRWSIACAVEWYSKLDWIVGCNFLPSSSINQVVYDIYINS